MRFKKLSDGCDFDDVNHTSTLSTDDLFNVDSVNIYPNPVTNRLRIEANNIELTKVEIYSLLGQKLVERTAELHAVNVDSLPKGIYLMKIYSGNKHITKKVVKR